MNKDTFSVHQIIFNISFSWMTFISPCYPSNLFSSFLDSVNEIYHYSKYTIAPVSTNHFPEITLNELLGRFESNNLIDVSNDKICDNFKVSYSKNGYTGELKLCQINFGYIYGNTEFDQSENFSLYHFIKTSIPENELFKVFTIKDSKMGCYISLSYGSIERWKKIAVYEYMLFDPPLETKFRRIFIRLIAWRKRIPNLY